MKRILLISAAFAMLMPAAVYASEPQLSISLDKKLSIGNIPSAEEKGLIVWVEDEEGTTIYANLFSAEEHNDGLTLYLPSVEMGDTLTVSMKGEYEYNGIISYDQTLVWAEFKGKYDEAKETEVDALLSEYSEYINSEYLDEYLGLDKEKKAEVLSAVLNSELSSFEDIKEIIDTETAKVLEEDDEDNNTNKNQSSGSSGGGGGGGGGSYNIAVPKKQETNTAVNTNTEVIVDNNEALKTQPFDDIEEVSWAKESILLLKALEIVNGDDGNMFYPKREVSRAEFIKMLVMTFDQPDTSLKCTFDDVSENDWYHDYIALAQEYSLAQGDENRFSPNSRITRQDAAVLIWRFAQFYGRALTDGDSAEFTDKSAIADYAIEAIDMLTKSGIISGMDDGSFMPHGACTRAMAAHMIANIIKLK